MTRRRSHRDVTGESFFYEEKQASGIRYGAVLSVVFGQNAEKASKIAIYKFRRQK